MNLTTLALFKAYAGITGTTKDALITSLLPQVSAQIARYLRRDLELTTYKSWVDGNGNNFLRLDNYPITQVYHVSTGSFSVATIENTSSTVIRALVTFDGVTLTLTEISTAGAETHTELAIATYKTLSALKTAVDAVSGWTMTITSSDYNNEPSALLRPVYSEDAYNGSRADLYLPLAPSSVRVTNALDGVIELTAPVTTQRDTRYAPIAPATIDEGFPEGTGNIFVWYKAGYTLPTDESNGTLPAGLHLLVHQIINDVLSSRRFNSNLQSESISGYSYSLRATEGGAITSAIENRKKDLNQYRRVSI